MPGREEILMITKYKIRIRNCGFQMLDAINFDLRKFSILSGATGNFLRSVGTKFHSSWEKQLGSNYEQHTDPGSRNDLYQEVEECTKR